MNSPLKNKQKRGRQKRIRRHHDGVLWMRLCFTLKVETGFGDPVSFERLRRICFDVPVADLDRLMLELEAAKVVTTRREWIARQDGKGDDLLLEYTYN